MEYNQSILNNNSKITKNLNINKTVCLPMLNMNSISVNSKKNIYTSQINNNLDFSILNNNIQPSKIACSSNAYDNLDLKMQSQNNQDSNLIGQYKNLIHANSIINTAKAAATKNILRSNSTSSLVHKPYEENFPENKKINNFVTHQNLNLNPLNKTNNNLIENDKININSNNFDIYNSKNNLNKDNSISQTYSNSSSNLNTNAGTPHSRNYIKKLPINNENIRLDQQNENKQINFIKQTCIIPRPGSFKISHLNTSLYSEKFEREKLGESITSGKVIDFNSINSQNKIASPSLTKNNQNFENRDRIQVNLTNYNNNINTNVIERDLEKDKRYLKKFIPKYSSQNRMEDIDNQNPNTEDVSRNKNISKELEKTIKSISLNIGRLEDNQKNNSISYNNSNPIKNCNNDWNINKINYHEKSEFDQTNKKIEFQTKNSSNINKNSCMEKNRYCNTDFFSSENNISYIVDNTSNIDFLSDQKGNLSKDYNQYLRDITSKISNHFMESENILNENNKFNTISNISNDCSKINLQGHFLSNNFEKKDDKYSQSNNLNLNNQDLYKKSYNWEYNNINMYSQNNCKNKSTRIYDSKNISNLNNIYDNTTIAFNTSNNCNSNFIYSSSKSIGKNLNTSYKNRENNITNNENENLYNNTNLNNKNASLETLSPSRSIKKGTIQLNRYINYNNSNSLNTNEQIHQINEKNNLNRPKLNRSVSSTINEKNQKCEYQNDCKISDSIYYNDTDIKNLPLCKTTTYQIPIKANILNNLNSNDNNLNDLKNNFKYFDSENRNINVYDNNSNSSRENLYQKDSKFGKNINSNKNITNTNLQKPSNNFNSDINYDPDKLHISIESQSQNGFIINLEDLLMIEERLYELLCVINKIEICHHQCFDWWNFYFNSSLCGSFENYFKEPDNKQIIKDYMLTEMISICITYDSCFYFDYYRNTNYILKSLFTTVHESFLILCDYVLSKVSTESIENLWVKKLKNLICHNFKLGVLKNNHTLEIKKNNKYVYDYLKLILKNHPNESIFDPLNTFMINLNKLKIETLNDFFRSKIIRIENKRASNLASCIKKSGEEETKIVFPPYVKYTHQKEYCLVLDLDETLIHFKIDSNDESTGVLRLRPGIYKFLDEISKYYEIIVFTAATRDVYK